MPTQTSNQKKPPSVHQKWPYQLCLKVTLNVNKFGCKDLVKAGLCDILLGKIKDSLNLSVTICGADFCLLSEVNKGILQISTVSLLETDIVEVMVLSPLPETGRSRLEIFTLPKILPQGKEKIRNQF